MSGRRFRILVQIRKELAERLAGAVPDIESVSIPLEGDLPPDVDGEVLLTLPWGSPNLGPGPARRGRWVPGLRSRGGKFPAHSGRHRGVPCSGGPSAIPIAEWVLAVMLAFEKRLPEAWIDGAPAGGWSRMALGGL